MSRAEEPGPERVAGTSSVAGTIFLTLITLGVYFYFHLYRSLRRFEADAPSEAGKADARRVRWCVSAGIFVQFVALLVLLGALVPVLSDPAGSESFWNGLSEGRVVVPPGLERADQIAQLANWAGWLLFWAPLFAFLAAGLRELGEPTGSAGFGGVFIGVRLVLGLGGLVGLSGMATAGSAVDSILFLVLVGCSVSAANAVWIARARAA